MLHEGRAPRSASATAVVLLRDQVAMPPQEGVGRDEGLEVPERPATQGLGFRGQAATLRIGEPQSPRSQLLAQDAVFFLEVVDDVTLLLVDPPGQGHDEELQRLGKRTHSGERNKDRSPPKGPVPRTSRVESGRRKVSIEFLDSTRNGLDSALVVRS